MSYNWGQMSERERDALVAEKIMGWTKLDEVDDEYVLFSDEYVAFNLNEEHYNIRFAGIDFCPSTHIQYAWEVVERMREKYFHSDIGWRSSGWHAGFVGRMNVSYVNRSTAPEAICLAALKAVDVDFET